MSFISKLFKAAKTTGSLVNTGMDELNKGLEGLAKISEQRLELEQHLKSCTSAFKLSKGLIDAALQAAEADLKYSKYSPEVIERAYELMRESSISFDKKPMGNTPWPTLIKPVSDDQQMQAKIDTRFKEYTLELEEEYERVKNACKRTHDLEGFMIQRLQNMNCPDHLIAKMCPTHKPQISAWPFI